MVKLSLLSILAVVVCASVVSAVPLKHNHPEQAQPQKKYTVMRHIRAKHVAHNHHGNQRPPVIVAHLQEGDRCFNPALLTASNTNAARRLFGGPVFHACSKGLVCQVHSTTTVVMNVNGAEKVTYSDGRGMCVKQEQSQPPMKEEQKPMALASAPMDPFIEAMVADLMQVVMKTTPHHLLQQPIPFASAPITEPALQHFADIVSNAFKFKDMSDKKKVVVEEEMHQQPIPFASAPITEPALQHVADIVSNAFKLKDMSDKKNVVVEEENKVAAAVVVVAPTTPNPLKIQAQSAAVAEDFSQFEL